MYANREKNEQDSSLHRLVVGAALLLATISSGEILTFIFGSFILVFGYFFLRTRSPLGTSPTSPS